MKRIITCLLAVSFLYVLFNFPVYLPNKELDFDITSAWMQGGYDEEYLTDDEIKLLEKWLPSLYPKRPGVEAGVGYSADFVKFRIESEDDFLALNIPALYRNATPDFQAPVEISGASHYSYLSQNNNLTWDVYIMLKEVYNRREDSFQKLLESKKAAD